LWATQLAPPSSETPRGFAFGRDGTLFLASSIGPNSEGDNTILAFDPKRTINHSWKAKIQISIRWTLRSRRTEM
jgi:hypothetical protein